MNIYKKYPIYACLIILLALFSACSKDNIEPEPEHIPDWIEIKGKSEFDLFNDIYFLNDNFGLISGTSGTLLKTPDGGSTWKKMDVGTEITLSRTSGLDEKTFAAAGNSLFVTTDQGNSFSEIISLQDVGRISDIKFINKQLWYVVGGNRVYKTIDGGTNWNLIYSIESLNLYRMHFTSANTFYVFGGNHWNNWMGTGEIWSYGFLSKTTDGGDNWVEFQDSIIISTELFGISFINDNVGYVTNGFKEIYKTTDGGYHWTYINSSDFSPGGLLFINEHTGYCPSGKKLYKTTDGGANWKVDLDLDSLEFSSIQKIIKTENYLYVLDFVGRVFKKSKTNYDNNY